MSKWHIFVVPSIQARLTACWAFTSVCVHCLSVHVCICVWLVALSDGTVVEPLAPGPAAVGSSPTSQVQFVLPKPKLIHKVIQYRVPRAISCTRNLVLESDQLSMDNYFRKPEHESRTAHYCAHHTLSRPSYKWEPG